MMKDLRWCVTHPEYSGRLYHSVSCYASVSEGDCCRASGQASDRRMEMWHLCDPTLARNPQMQTHKTSTAPPLFRKNNTQVHDGTFITIPALIWERTPQVQWKHFRGPFSLYGPPSACISCSASYIDKHRFVAPGCTRLSHYSKCQLCK